MANFMPIPCDPIIADDSYTTNVVDFGAKGDWNTNGTDDTAAFDAAIAAAPDGGTVIVPPGHYGLDNVQIFDKTIDIVGHGAWLVQLSDLPLLQWDVTWDTVDVTSFTDVTLPLFGDVNNPETVTDVVVASLPAGIAPECRVRIVADDEIPGSVPTSSGGLRRVGEFATVLEVNGNTIRLGHTLTEPFTINPRLALVPGHRARLEGINIRPDPAGDAALWNGPIVQINGRSDVKVERVRIEGAFSFGLEINGCEGVMVDSFIARNIRNDRSNFRFGYGVTLNGSENCSVENSHFFNCRHGFTTDSQSQPAGSTNLSEFGRSKYITVTSCTGNNCTNAAFDTHNPTYGITFQSCIAAHEIRLPDSTGAGFQVRGKHIKIADCQALNCYRGIIVKDSGIDDATHDIHISNCHVDNAEKFALVIEGTATITNPVLDVYIEGGYFHSTHFDEVVRFIQSEVKMHGTTLVAGPLATSTSSCLVRIIDNSKLVAQNCCFDIRNITGTNARAVNCREQDCQAFVYDSVFYQNPGQVSFRGPAAGAGGPVPGQFRGAGLKYDTFAVPLTTEVKHATVDPADLFQIYNPATGTFIVY